ncbi:MAG: glutamate 5-kinase [Anaeroplasmataceae bacterium]
MKRIVIKIGSSSLIKNGKLDNKRILDLVRELSIFHDEGIKPIVVTSGAVAVGAYKLGVKPKDIKMKQACAAVGQAILMNGYETICDLYGLKCAQILLNHDDFADRKRLINLENTINTLIENDVIPIINENDALAVEEIMVGDNDTLAALIAPMVGASRLVLMSDVDGLYTDNPKTCSDAKFIRVIPEITESIIEMGHGSSTSVGTGGMATKIKAAKIATTSGVDMIIMNALNIENLHKAFSDDFDGSLFLASKEIMNSKDQWILYKTRPHGSVIIDEGAMKALLDRKSLLPKGIIGIAGAFEDGEVINVVCNDKVIAKGICKYNSYDLAKIKGCDSKAISDILGYKGKNTVIHANDIVLIGEEYNE